MQTGQVSDPVEARNANAAGGMQTSARAGCEAKHPRRAFQLQAMPRIVKDKENSSGEHLQL